MHGLINRSIQSFVSDTYGGKTWSAVVDAAQLEITSFEAMLDYADALTPRVLRGMAAVINHPIEEQLEDFGTYLVSHPNFEAVRRLLRFGGVDFLDFLHSVDDLPDRARLAVPDLLLPKTELRTLKDNKYSITCHTPVEGYGYVLVGVLRVMADDYGALVVLDHDGGRGMETITISLVASEFSQGRRFDLCARVS